MTGVSVTSLTKAYGALRVLHDIDLEVLEGEFTVLLGPSGCGKSTLLSAIAGLDDIDAGTIAIAGNDVTDREPSQRGIAMVFQSYALYPTMTVRGNLSFGLKVKRLAKAEIDRRVTWAAGLLQLSTLLDRKPAHLSGGQRQRVAIGHELGTLTERFAKSGIQLGYHNHHWEMDRKDGDKTALELLFDAAGSSGLAWQVDVAWLVRGHADPKAWMTRYQPIITAAHVKDIAPPGHNLDQDGWADVGAGTLDWPDLWTACLAAGARHMVVEHDKPSDPGHTARASLSFLRTITG